MRFLETPIAGAFVIEPDRLEDSRGFFARTWCAREFEARGLETRIAQRSLSFNQRSGTVRGMHFQAAPYREVKLVRCARGAIFDVIVDLRPDSTSYRRWVGEELSADNGRMLYIPAGIAQGFQTLADDTEVDYQMSEFYHPESSKGFRWDDPTIGIKWPLPIAVIADKDRDGPFLDEIEARA